MSKKPTERYPSMADLAAALDEYLRAGASAPSDPALTGGAAPTVEASTEPAGLATQLLERLLARAVQMSLSPAEQARRRRRTVLLAAGAGALLIAVIVLLVLLLGQKQRPAEVTVRLEGLPAIDEQVIVLLDGEQIAAQKLEDFLALRPGEHELVFQHADGEVIERRRFTVASEDDRRTIQLPPAEAEPPREREPVVLPGKGPFRKLAGAAIEEIAFSPDGSRLATACRDGTIVVWDVATRKEEFQLHHPATVDCLAFTPDGRELIAGDYQKEIIVWHLADRSMRKVLQHPEPVRALAVSPNGRWLFSGAATRMVWSLADGKEVASSSRDHDWSLRAPVFSPDGTLVAGVGHNSPAIRVWDAPPRKALPPLPAQKAIPLSLVFPPRGRVLAAGYHDGKVIVWNLDTQQVRVTLPPAPGPVTKLYYDSTRGLLVGVTPSRVILWDLASKQIIPTGDPGASLKVCTLAPDGRTLAYAVGPKGTEVRLLDIEQLRVKAP
jgi:hypothetical protein